MRTTDVVYGTVFVEMLMRAEADRGLRRPLRRGLAGAGKPPQMTSDLRGPALCPARARERWRLRRRTP